MRFFVLSMTVASVLWSSVEAVEIVAHRGASGEAPENTVAAFDLAWKQDADACELDLYLTADRQIAVLHDKTTLRTTGVNKVVAESTLAELRELDAGGWKAAAFAGEKIPTLAEALATLPAGDKRFFLEIKCGPEVVPVLATELEPWKLRAAQLCIIAFDEQVAASAKEALPWLKVYRLSGELTKKKQPMDLQQLIENTKGHGLDGLDLSSKWPWNVAMVEQIRDAGLEVFVYTVNDPQLAKKLAELGVDGITTDYPALIKQAATGH
jgi:glycerophosphoryl diester phosphodiesterase